MSGDDLLEQLARAAREARARDGQWEALAEGTLSEAERAELERLAQEDPQAQASYEAFRPLDAEARERIIARVEQERAGQKVVPLAPRRGRRAVVSAAVGALAALAAGVLVLVLPPGGGAPVPGYGLSLSGEQQLRGQAPGAEVARLGPDSRLTLVLRPERAVEGPVGVRAFLLRPGEARPWTPPLEVSAEGAVRVVGRVEELLPVPPGEWTLALAVGRPEALPQEADEVRALVEEGRAPDSDAWRLLTHRLLLSP